MEKNDIDACLHSRAFGGRLRRCLVLLFAALTGSAFGGTEPGCNPAGSIAEMSSCAYQSHDAAEAQMSMQYRALMASLSPAARGTLQTEQRVWVKARDRRCREYSGTEDESPRWSADYYSCLTNATQRRIKKLSYWKADYELSRH